MTDAVTEAVTDPVVTPAEALRYWPSYAGQALAPAPGGLINRTWFVGEAAVLQCLHPIFDASVNQDIAALVPVLLGAGVSVPELLQTDQGACCVVGASSGIWRLLKRLPGVIVDRVTSPAQAASAATLLAAFHGALGQSTYQFKFARLGIHDTAKHFRSLAAALSAHKAHVRHGEVAGLAAEIGALWDTLDGGRPLPRRIGHGDPKIANFLFSETDAEVATSILDLDTMGWTTLDAELGDALRSWCNRATEDAPQPEFDVTLFAAAATAYMDAAGSWLTDAERQTIPGSAARIAVELASRFAADVLDDSYFGWSPARYGSRSEHNLARAKNQLALAKEIAAQRGDLARLLGCSAV